MTRALFLALLPLVACHAARDAPGAVTREQDRQLNDAAVALDANAVTANDSDQGNTR